MKGIKGNNSISRHIQDSLWLYIVCLLCFFTGVVLGIYTVKYMGDMERKDLIDYFLGFKESIGSVEVNNKQILFQSMKSNLPMIVAIWIMGITIVGIPVILIVDIIKGFTFGFTMSFVFYSMGYKGGWFLLMGVLPQNIIYIPCIIVGSVFAMKLSLMKLKDRLNKQINYNGDYFFDYSMTFLIVTLIMILGFLYEAYITPKAIQSVALIVRSVFL